MEKLLEPTYLVLLNKVFFKTNNFIIFIILFFIKINYLIAIEVKTLAQVNNSIITNEDVNNEKIILNYFNFNVSDQIALDNLIELKVKKTQIQIEKKSISDKEAENFLKILLKNLNKSVEDFRIKTNNKINIDLLKERIKIEMSWNKLITEKFSYLINFNVNEIELKIAKKENSEKNINNIILDEKNKKLQSLSDAYFNEIKNKTYIRLYGQ